MAPPGGDVTRTHGRRERRHAEDLMVVRGDDAARYTEMGRVVTAYPTCSDSGTASEDSIR